MFTTRESIVSFLEAVCAEFRKPGILYLVGESSLVVEGLRDFCTEVIVASLVGEDDYAVFCEAVDVAASGVGWSGREACRLRHWLRQSRVNQ